jgi:hypothetical protein
MRTEIRVVQIEVDGTRIHRDLCSLLQMTNAISYIEQCILRNSRWIGISCTRTSSGTAKNTISNMAFRWCRTCTHLQKGNSTIPDCTIGRGCDCDVSTAQHKTHKSTYIYTFTFIICRLSTYSGWKLGNSSTIYYRMFCSALRNRLLWILLWVAKASSLDKDWNTRCRRRQDLS